MTENMKRVTEKAVAHYGKEHQVKKCIEEIGEFLQALSKYSLLVDKHKNWKTSTSGLATIEDRYLLQDIKQGEKHLQEEIADCIIMLQQMRLVYGPEGVDWWTNFKLERLEREIEKESV